MNKDFILKLRERFRLLPVLVAVACLTFIVRIGDAATNYKSLSNSAVAAEAEKKDEKPAEKPAPDSKAEPKVDLPATDPKVDSAKTDDAKADAPAPKDEKDPNDIKDVKTGTPVSALPDAGDTDLDLSTVRQDIYKDLMARRQQIEAREQELAKREALIKAATSEVDKKVTELTALRDEIQNLLKKQSGEEQANITRLVKIYEGMKPKDAARIFNTLDMDILLSVVTNMSERKSSPIIAQMDPERARSLTLFLAEQKQLPKESDAEPSAPTVSQ